MLMSDKGNFRIKLIRWVQKRSLHIGKRKNSPRTITNVNTNVLSISAPDYIKIT